MIKWLFRRWDQRRRRIDLETLWPVCKKYSRDLNQAREAFLNHASCDIAWTRQMSFGQIKTIDQLV